MDVLARTCIPCSLTRTYVSASILDHAHMCTCMVVQTHSCSGTCMHSHTCRSTHILTHIAQHSSMAPVLLSASQGRHWGTRQPADAPAPRYVLCLSFPRGTPSHPHFSRSCGPQCAMGRAGQDGALPGPGAGTATTSQNHPPAMASQFGSQTPQLSLLSAKPAISRRAPATGRSIIPSLFSASPSSIMAKSSHSQ